MAKINIYLQIERLLPYRLQKQLIDKDDLEYTRNSNLGAFEISD